MHSNAKELLNKAGIGLSKLFLNFFFIIISLMAIFPIIWMVYSSFKTDQEFAVDIISLPSHLDFSVYVRAIIIGKFDRYIYNNLYVTFVCVILITLFSFIIAYFLNRFRFKFRNFLFLLFTIGLLTPIYGFLVPLYIQFSNLGLVDKWFTLFFPITAFNMPLAIILYENFLSSVPYEVEESAMIDGAKLFQRIVSIALPMCTPILATVMVLDFLWVWNEYPFALILLNSDSLKTLSLGLSNFRGEQSTSYPLLFAALTLVTIPIIIVYSIFSNKIMEGMSAGAVKG